MEYVYMMEDEFFTTLEAAEYYKAKKGFTGLIDKAQLNVSFDLFCEAYEAFRHDGLSVLDSFNLAAAGPQ